MVHDLYLFDEDSRTKAAKNVYTDASISQLLTYVSK